MYFNSVHVELLQNHVRSREVFRSVEYVLGFGKLDPVVDSMIVLVTAALLIFLIGAVVAARRVAKLPRIRLV